MKSKRIDPPKTEIPKETYPCLLKHPIHDIIVLATGRDNEGVVTGTCVHHDGTDRNVIPSRLGEHCRAWCRTFELYDGTVELKN